MDKFFTKKESDLLINLLKSKDLDNINLAIHLIQTHPRFKSINKSFVFKIQPKYLKYFHYHVKQKESFEDWLNLFNKMIWGPEVIDTLLITKYCSRLITFITNRTFKHK